MMQHIFITVVKYLNTLPVSLTPLVKSRYTLLSTPNGTGNLFHRTYENAIMGQNSFNITNMKW
jgi:hypothetical protein